MEDKNTSSVFEVFLPQTVSDIFKISDTSELHYQS